MKKVVSSFLFLLGLHLGAMAQAPVITEIIPANTYPKGTVTIKGSGFSASAAQLRVLFGHVKGNIISASSTSLEVEVPPQARLSNIEVTNLTTGLSVKSARRFMPSFSGETFNPAKFTPAKFENTTSFPFSSNPDEVRDLCSCDLNNDNRPDIIATKFPSSSNSNVPQNIMVLEQSNTSTPGNLIFKSPVYKSLGISTENVSCGDLDGDGFPDIVVSRGNPTRNSIQIIKNLNGTVSNIATWPATSYLLEGGINTSIATRIAIRDLDGDGKPEIVVTDGAANGLVFVFVNTSTPGSINFNSVLKINVQSSPALLMYGLEVQDLNGDGLPELIVTQFQNKDVFILKNESTPGNISFAATQKIEVLGTLNKIAAADFNRDGKLDLVITANASNAIRILINETAGPSGPFQFSVQSITADSGPWGIDVSDIDGDSDPDFVVAHYQSNKVSVYLHDGNFSTPTFTKTTVTTVRNSRDVIAGDLDGDGKPDLAFTSLISATSNFSIEILRNTNCFKPKIINEGTLCSGVTLNSVPGLNVTYTWLRDGSPVVSNSPNAFVVASNPGVYTVTATGEGGACANIASANSITVAAGTAPTIDFTSPATAVCSGNTLTLSANVSPAGTSYEWTLPNGSTQPTASPTLTVSTSATTQHAGTYKLKAIMGTCTSDVSSKLVEIIDFNALSISSPSNAFCEGGNVILSVDAGYIYDWKRNGASVGGTNNTYAANIAGSYSVAVSSASCPPKETSAVNVIQVSAPVANFQVGDPKCANTDIQFTSTSTVDPNATAKYSWTFGDGKTSTLQNPTNRYTTANTYNVGLTVSYNGVSGCSNVISRPVPVTNSTLPVVTATPTTICPGDQASVTVSGGTFTSINWSSGGTGSSITITQPGDYTVTTTDGNGCVLIKDFSIPSKVVPALVISPEPPSVAIPAGGSVQLTASGDADTYEWTPSEGLDNATVANPIASPATTTTYVVTATITGQCSAKETIEVIVNGAVINIKAMVAFSPNGDGINEKWLVEGADRPDLRDCTMSIFDGRGRRVYEKRGYTNDWDGTYQGKPVPGGTYYYVFGCESGAVTGSVLVFR